VTVESISSEALAFATGRVEDFASVQQHRDWDEKLEAVTVLLEGLGLDEQVKHELSEWLDGFIGEQSAEILLGLLLGLFVNQYQNEEA
jgi:hypothetical protein